jgi:hypothetical protein
MIPVPSPIRYFTIGPLGDPKTVRRLLRVLAPGVEEVLLGDGQWHPREVDQDETLPEVDVDTARRIATLQGFLDAVPPDQ